MLPRLSIAKGRGHSIRIHETFMARIVPNASSKRLMFLGLCAILTSVAIAFAMVSSADSQSSFIETIAILILLGSCVLALTSIREIRGNPSHPLSVLIITITVHYGLAAVLLALSTQRADVPVQSLPTACLMVAASIPLLLAGFFMPIGQRLAYKAPVLCFPAESKRVSSLWVRALVLYGIGWVFRVFLLSQGVYHIQQELSGYLVQYKSVLDDFKAFADFSFLAIVLLVFLKRAPRVLLMLVLSGEIAYGLAYGGASAIFGPFILVGFVYSFYCKRIKWWQVAVGIAVLLLVIAPLSYAYRAIYNSYLTHAGPSVDNVESAVSTTALDPVRAIQDNEENIARRMSYVSSLLLVLDRVPRLYPFQRGDTFVPQLLSLPIPRALWAGKPNLSTGREFAIDFFDDPNKSEVGSNAGIGMIAEFYYNFGFWGLICLVPVGVVIRFVWERTKLYIAIEPCSAVRIPFLILLVAGLETPLALYIGGLLRGPVTLYLYMILLYGTLPAVRRNVPNKASVSSDVRVQQN